MAEYRGFTCDDCGAVVDKNQRTQRTVKYRGPVTEGEFSEDLCPECVSIPDGVQMRPLRKRTVQRVEETPEETPEEIRLASNTEPDPAS